MRTVTLILLTLVGSAVAACSDADSEPLLAGDVTGTFGTTDFTIINGIIGRSASGSYGIALGSDDMGCSSITADEPPPGNWAVIQVSTLEPGTYSNTNVVVAENHSDYHSLGTNSGVLVISSVSATSVAGSIAYADEVDGTALALNGDFEVKRCP